jgi:hypothetical protein
VKREELMRLYDRMIAEGYREPEFSGNAAHGIPGWPQAQAWTLTWRKEQGK